MQQVRVVVRNQVFDRFEYLFHTARARWEPVLEDEADHASTSEEVARQQRSLIAGANEQEWLESLNLRPNPEHLEWLPVRDLRLIEPAVNKIYRDLAPEAGGFILLSLRRRQRAKK